MAKAGSFPPSETVAALMLHTLGHLTKFGQLIIMI